MSDLVHTPQNEPSEHTPICAVSLGENDPVVIGRKDGFHICRDRATRAVALGAVHMETSDSDVITQLLLGCMSAGQSHQQDEKPRSRAAACLEDHVFDLCGSYHSARVAPVVFRVARDRFREIGERDVAEFAESKAIEEFGHEVLALNDLKSLGLPAEAIVARIKPQSTMHTVAWFEALGRHERPYGVFGDFHTREWMSLSITRERINQVQAWAPRHVNITRCMRTHSCVGADVAHVADNIAFISELPLAERNQVCRAAYQTARIIFRDYPEDVAIRAQVNQLLADWQWVPFEGVRAAVA